MKVLPSHLAPGTQLAFPLVPSAGLELIAGRPSSWRHLGLMAPRACMGRWVTTWALRRHGQGPKTKRRRQLKTGELLVKGGRQRDKAGVMRRRPWISLCLSNSLISSFSPFPAISLSVLGCFGAEYSFTLRLWAWAITASPVQAPALLSPQAPRRPSRSRQILTYKTNRPGFRATQEQGQATPSMALVTWPSAN